MMTLYDAAAAFSRRYPVHPDSQPSQGWNMNCALLMARFALAPGGVGWAVAPRAYGDAITVANNSGLLNKNAAAAPAGAWHYWNWGVFGHVGSDLSGGGLNVFMASAYLRDEWGTHLGLNSVAGYNAANRSATYLGWATNYRGGKYNLPAAVAGTGSATPLDNSTSHEEEEDEVTIKTIYVPGLGRIRYVPGTGPVWYLNDGQWKAYLANFDPEKIPAELQPSNIPTVGVNDYQVYLYGENGFPSTWDLTKGPVWRPQPTEAVAH